MKRLMLFIPVMMAGTLLFAQNDCSKNHPIYKIDNTATPKPVYSFGSDPEFPFLRHLSTPGQVVKAMNSSENARMYPRQMKELNKLLTEIGFENGAKDVTASSVFSFELPKGTAGNMGNGQFHYMYARIESGNAQKAWKIVSGDGCYITFLNACGNAFYPSGVDDQNATTYTGKPNCKNVAVNVTSEPKEITLSDADTKTKKKQYIYYRKGCPCIACGSTWNKEDMNNGLMSEPLLVKTEDISEPLTYKITANGTGTATVCKSKNSSVVTDVNIDKETISVERQSAYLGYQKPTVEKEYIEVSRRDYRRALRNPNLWEDWREHRIKNDQ